MSSLSTYLKPSALLEADHSFVISDTVAIEPYSKEMADRLAETLLKRNVFTRHSWEKDFYVGRARELANKTVIVVKQHGDPSKIIADAESTASLLEKILVISALFGFKRGEVQRRLGIGRTFTTERYLAMSEDFSHLKSQQTRKPDIRGITIDSRFRNRFRACRFEELFKTIHDNPNKVTQRLNRSINWLFDSIVDQRLDAAFVKLAISIESLLVLSESESLAQSISERSAFLLSPNRDQRQEISRNIKRFYNTRSGIVHGSKKKLKHAQPALLDGIGRLIVILWLALAHNSGTLKDDEDVRKWCEEQRWGTPERMLPNDFPKKYLTHALRFCAKT